MTLKELKALFESFEEDFLEFENIEQPRSKRPDLHAFLLLDELCPGRGRDMVSGAEHDVIYLDVDVNKLSKVITKEQVLELVRCGVSYDESLGCLYMFV